MGADPVDDARHMHGGAQTFGLEVSTPIEDPVRYVFGLVKDVK
jgi:hypothetical protein